MYKMGAILEKARPPYDWVSKRGSTRRAWFEDLSDLAGSYAAMREERYGGARP